MQGSANLEFRQVRFVRGKGAEHTRAAKRLNISRSAVSEQGHLLVQEIGFTLFGRTPSPFKMPGVT